MRRDDVIAVLRAHEAPLRAQGISHIALFGSVARNEAGPQSDIDIMVEIDTASRISLWDYSGIILFLQELFEGKVDVANREGLKPYVRPSAERDAIYAF